MGGTECSSRDYLEAQWKLVFAGGLQASDEYGQHPRDSHIAPHLPLTETKQERGNPNRKETPLGLLTPFLIGDHKCP